MYWRASAVRPGKYLARMRINLSSSHSSIIRFILLFLSWATMNWSSQPKTRPSRCTFHAFFAPSFHRFLSFSSEVAWCSSRNPFKITAAYNALNFPSSLRSTFMRLADSSLTIRATHVTATLFIAKSCVLLAYSHGRSPLKSTW